MTSDNHILNREFQRDARAWSAFTGTKYTSALRQVSSPLAQGLLGERVSARQLIATLHDHELIGARGGDPILSDNAFRSDDSWDFDGETDFIELALITDMLRLFTHISDAETPEVGSYSLKHTAEDFLSPHCSYVSNGRLIWAAAALGLQIADPKGSGPNLVVGVSEREHDYVRRMVRTGWTRPKADHYRPAGYTHLQAALARVAAGESAAGPWVRPTVVPTPVPFHEWLILQVGRDDVVGDLAYDYSAGVRESVHRIAHTPDELLAIFHQDSHSLAARDGAASTIAEWMRKTPSTTPIRTKQIGSGTDDHPGWGDGDGTANYVEYRCPCGSGVITEEYNNTPGSREHDVRMDCDKCRREWCFVPGNSARDWGLEPVAASATV